MSPGHPAAGAPGPYFATFVEGRRGEILDAALGVFAEKGYEAGTVRDIAARVGVSEPALYRHFPSKEAVLIEIVSLAGDRIVGTARSRIDQVEVDDLRGWLAGLLRLRRAQGEGLDNKRVMAAIMDAAPHHPAMRQAFRCHFGQPMMEGIRGLVPRVDAELGIERTPEETEARARAFISLFAGYFMTSMFFDAPPDDDAIVDAMLAMMGWD
jgi:AcrR family transcriptional regulator